MKCPKCGGDLIADIHVKAFEDMSGSDSFTCEKCDKIFGREELK